MFSVFDRGQRRPQLPLICVPEEPLRADHARLAAWAAVLGQERHPVARPHRGHLPDVDWSSVQVVPARPGPLARFWRWLRMPPLDDPVSAAAPTALAQTPTLPYLASGASDTAPVAEADVDRRAA
jgi:hypothetical protein